MKTAGSYVPDFSRICTLFLYWLNKLDLNQQCYIKLFANWWLKSWWVRTASYGEHSLQLQWIIVVFFKTNI